MKRQKKKMVKIGHFDPSGRCKPSELLWPQKWLQTHGNGMASIAKHNYVVSEVFGSAWMDTDTANMDFCHVMADGHSDLSDTMSH